MAAVIVAHKATRGVPRVYAWLQTPYHLRRVAVRCTYWHGGARSQHRRARSSVVWPHFLCIIYLRPMLVRACVHARKLKIIIFLIDVDATTATAKNSNRSGGGMPTDTKRLWCDVTRPAALLTSEQGELIVLVGRKGREETIGCLFLNSHGQCSAWKQNNCRAFRGTR